MRYYYLVRVIIWFDSNPYGKAPWTIKKNNEMWYSYVVLPQ